MPAAVAAAVADASAADVSVPTVATLGAVGPGPSAGNLLPDRHPQNELFICDVADAILKDDMASMEHPFFSLSKKPDTTVRRYENGEKWLEVVPSVKGLATIYDKDVLIYCISQMIHKANDGAALSRNIRLVARDLLVFTNRRTGGKDYDSLHDALDRLDGTRIRTNVQTAGIEVNEGFGLIESYKVVRSEKTGRILEMSVTLSEWVFNAIQAKEVLTIDRDYFRLRKAIERRVYEIARKQCGRQKRWSINLALLKNKCGSRAPLKGFRHDVKQIVVGDHLPQYSVTYDEERDMVTFYNREFVEAVASYNHLTLEPESYNEARIVASGWDVYELEKEWRFWMAENELDLPRDPDRAFVGFCRRWAERKACR